MSEKEESLTKPIEEEALSPQPSDSIAEEPENRPVRVALDAMGGDNAPGAIVDGAILGIKTINDLEVILIGDEETIKTELKKQDFDSHPAISVLHAEEAIGMDEAPSVALRKKKNSSIHIGIKLVKEKKADVFISAGNTGAVMAVATVVLRTIEGIDRAAIAVPLPTSKGYMLMLDAGANVSCKAAQLYQFGVMGAAYARYMLGESYPKVGLLSIGEEDIKGNVVTREAFEMLNKSSLNFVGNTEAKLLYRGVADVAVCEGFTGNIALKISESIVEMINSSLKEMFTQNLRGKLGYLFLRPSLEKFKKRMDHSEVGGALLLGIDGAVFISHGSSNAKSIKSALSVAKKFVEENVNGHIREDLAKNMDIHDTKGSDDEGLWSQMKRKIGLAGSDEQDHSK